MPPFKPSHLAVVSVRAQDVPATAHFYRDVVGLQMLPHHGHRPAFDLGRDTYLVVSQGQPAPVQDASSRFPLIAFAVENLDDAIAHLAAHGIELSGGIETNAEARWVLFCDPAGNLVEFAEFFELPHS